MQRCHKSAKWTILMASLIVSCILFAKFPHKIHSTVPSMNSSFMFYVLMAHPYACFLLWLGYATPIPNLLRKVHVYSAAWSCVKRDWMGWGERATGNVLKTVNPTLCHLSDECVATECGMYNKICFYCCGIYSWTVNLQPSSLWSPEPCLVEYE